MSEIKRYSNTPEFVDRRNQRLHEFFAANGLGNQIRIIGDENKPMILYLDQHVVPCYVKNFDLVFDATLLAGEPDSLLKKLLDQRFKLRNEPEHGPEIRRFLEMALEQNMRRAYRIKADGKLLRGWTHKTTPRTPILGDDRPKVYLSEENAILITKELTALGYECEII